MDANEILGLGISSYRSIEPTNRIKITFKARKEYIFNPNIDLYELEEFNDFLYVDFPDFGTAQAHLYDWIVEWQAVLDE